MRVMDFPPHERTLSRPRSLASRHPLQQPVRQGMNRSVGVSPPSSRSTHEEIPVVPVWFHSHGRIWVPFPESDNVALEEAWQSVKNDMPAKVRDPPMEDKSQKGWLPQSWWSYKMTEAGSVLPPPPPPPVPTEKQAVPTYRILDPDEPASERRFRVPVLEDHLFDVDLSRMIVRMLATLTEDVPCVVGWL